MSKVGITTVVTNYNKANTNVSVKSPYCIWPKHMFLQPNEIEIHNWAYYVRKTSTIKYGNGEYFLLVEYYLRPQSHKCVLLQKGMMLLSFARSWTNCENCSVVRYILYTQTVPKNRSKRVIGTKIGLSSWSRIWVLQWWSSKNYKKSLIGPENPQYRGVTLDRSLIPLNSTLRKQQSEWEPGSTPWVLRSPCTSSCVTQPCPTAECCASVWPVREVEVP